MISDVMRQGLLFLAARNEVRDVVTKVPATRDLVSNYVAGETVDQAVAASQDLVDQGLLVTIDYLGEDTRDLSRALEVKDTYLKLLQQLSARDLTAGGAVELSLKPSAFGTLVPGQDGWKLAKESMREVAIAARECGTTVTIDMEDHTTTSHTLDTVLQLREDIPDVGAVIQAYLRRTLGDITHITGEHARTRLCKGAYREPETVAYPDGHSIDMSYVKCMAALMAAPGKPLIATHDPRLVDIADALAIHNNRGPAEWEVQMLHGVRPEAQRQLAQSGHAVRVYLPFGDDWYGYLMRRMAEKPGNALLFARSLVSKR